MHSKHFTLQVSIYLFTDSFIQHWPPCKVSPAHQKDQNHHPLNHSLDLPWNSADIVKTSSTWENTLWSQRGQRIFWLKYVIVIFLFIIVYVIPQLRTILLPSPSMPWTWSGGKFAVAAWHTLYYRHIWYTARILCFLMEFKF